MNLRMLLCLLMVACGVKATGAEAPSRPNILWISCEDINPNLGCFGDRYAVTPVLDRFAAEGVRYTNCYGITGVCAPNRSCLITGMYPSSTGAHDMRTVAELPPNIKCFPEYLRAAGYYCSNNVKTDYNFATPATAWDECSRQAHWRKRKPGQPFFAVFNLDVSHESQVRVDEAKFARNTERLTPVQRHDPAKAPLPRFHPDAPEVRRDWAKYYDLITAVDYEAGDLLKALEEDGLAENTIVFFFGDNGAGMPGCKKWIWESGLHVPLIVRFPAKYERWAPAARGGECDRMVSFVDFAPTVLSLCDLAAPPHIQGSAFLGTRAGKPRQYVHAMRDRMAERYDTVRAVRDSRFQYIRNFMPHLSWSQNVSYTSEMPTMQVWQRLADAKQLNADQSRYFSPTKPVEELYETAKDPHQLVNLANDPAYRADLERLRAECRRWMLDSGDLGLLPDYELVERAKGRTRFDVSRTAKLNPLAELLLAAEEANRLSADAIPALVKRLACDDAAVRFWGATGLAALGQKAAPAKAALLKAMSADPSPVVRLAAADGALAMGETDKAVAVVLNELKSESPELRLRALNVLDRMGEAARPHLDTIESARMSAGGPVAEYVNRMVEYVPAKLKKTAR